MANPFDIMDIGRIVSGGGGGGSSIPAALASILSKQLVSGRPVPSGSGQFTTSSRSINEILHPAANGIGSGLGLPKPGSLEEILAELQRLQDPSRYSVDPALLERQAMAAASAQYAPVTAALRQQASGAERKANRNSAQLGSMDSR